MLAGRENGSTVRVSLGNLRPAGRRMPATQTCLVSGRKQGGRRNTGRQMLVRRPVEPNDRPLTLTNERDSRERPAPNDISPSTRASYPRRRRDRLICLRGVVRRPGRARQQERRGADTLITVKVDTGKGGLRCGSSVDGAQTVLGQVGVAPRLAAKGRPGDALRPGLTTSVPGAEDTCRRRCHQPGWNPGSCQIAWVVQATASSSSPVRRRGPLAWLRPGWRAAAVVDSRRPRHSRPGWSGSGRGGLCGTGRRGLKPTPGLHQRGLGRALRRRPGPRCPLSVSGILLAPQAEFCQDGP
jgi:hypothetical protein